MLKRSSYQRQERTLDLGVLPPGAFLVPLDLERARVILSVLARTVSIGIGGP